ncbi:MAG: hypothetical protein H6695_10950 [Deferribacteres bacterium]|nr:hypothetical protein [candidate division KSB1 bacterium]MCB9510693.1 hypothetical protein [Deferribacteres bacterium]
MQQVSKNAFRFKRKMPCVQFDVALRAKNVLLFQARSLTLALIKSGSIFRRGWSDAKICGGTGIVAVLSDSECCLQGGKNAKGSHAVA